MDDEAQQPQSALTTPDPEIAYQRWAFVDGRNATAVAAALDLPARTVQDWVRRYRWPERVRREVAAIAPDIHHDTVTHLITGAAASASYLHRVVTGDEVVTRDDRPRLLAAIALLDRAGYSPLARAEPRMPAAPSADPAAVAALPDEALIGIPD